MSGLELRRKTLEACGFSFRPKTRDMAICAVVWSKVGITGLEFKFDDGRTFKVPSGETLRQPEGSDYWNDRYALFIGEQIAEEIRDEVDGYEIPSEDWPAVESDDGIALKFLREFCEKRKVNWNINSGGLDGHTVSIFYPLSHGSVGTGKTPAIAICRAIIQAAEKVGR